MTDIRRDYLRPLLAASAVLLLASSPVLADRVLTDPDSGRRLLLRDDGTYRILPPDPGAAAQGTGWANPAAAPARQAAPSAPSTGSRGSAGPAAPSYRGLAFEDVAHAGRGEFVAIEGWIGTLGTGDSFLMFRDRTVSPPYVVVRMSQDAAEDTRAGGAAADGLSTLRSTRNWAADLNARCREACAARIEGEVVPAPPGGAPEIIAHHVDVSP